MPYTIDPRAPRVRRDAAQFAKKYGVRTAARRYGVSPGTITKWMQKAAKMGVHPIPTRSSRPKKHPKELSSELQWKIFNTRLKAKRSAEVIHRILADEGHHIVVIREAHARPWRSLEEAFSLEAIPPSGTSTGRRTAWFLGTTRYHPYHARREEADVYLHLD